jgi:hypothetical protein
MSASPSPPTRSSSTLGQIESFLADVICRLEPDQQEPKPGRPCIMPALALWGGVLVCVLRGYASQLALWRLLTQQGLWSYPRFPVTDQAVYNRLGDADPSPLASLFVQVRDALTERRAPYAAADLVPFAAGVYALDQTTLDPVARMLPALRGLPAGDPALLAGRLDGVFDLRRQQWYHLAITADPHQNEKVAARSLLQGLPTGALILADLGYFGFRWFDELTDAGYFWLSRMRSTSSYELIHTFYADGDTLDALIWLGKYRSDRAKHAVRLVQFRHGSTLYRYLTNVRDPRQFTLHQIAQTYARRWDIEMAIQLVKEHLGLRLFWSSKPAVLVHQIWAVLIIAQVLQALRLEIAGRAGVDPFEVSMPLLVEYVPRLLADRIDPVAFFVERGRAAGFIRPSRRTQIRAPTIPPHLLEQPPPGLLLERTPHYAGKIGKGPRTGRRHRQR